MALPDSFLEELRLRTPVAGLVGRRVKLARSGREWKGCCPFHTEKTPSFYVYDDHYHCFGCGAHGDAISFVMQTQNAGFMEAVEQLASEAGLEVPKPSRAAAEAEHERLGLRGVLDAAAAIYQRRLFQPEGQAALDYLRRRGLLDETIRRFGLGWSGDRRGDVGRELRGAGIDEKLLLEAGLMRAGEDGRPYDLFFSRIMFPIRDGRGRLISFGGRAMGEAQPKYLNGPETQLFSKRRNLYGLDLARAAREEIVVVEGYMDVIALHQAGFPGAVAPLGTALTEEQLQALWRLHPVPVLCFDADAAGRRAAVRAADIALPLLTPERSLAFMGLPEGEDPDSLVLRHGAGRFRACLAAKQAFSEALYGLLLGGMDQKLPEQRAALKKRLMEAANRIGDRALASEYRAELLGQFFRQKFQKKPARPNLTRPPIEKGWAELECVRNLTAILIAHPAILPRVEERYSRIGLPAWLEPIRGEIFSWAQARMDAGELLDSSALIEHLRSAGREVEIARIFAKTPLPLSDCAKAEATPEEAETAWGSLCNTLYLSSLRQDLIEAERAFVLQPDQQKASLLANNKTNLLRHESGERDDLGPVG